MFVFINQAALQLNNITYLVTALILLHAMPAAAQELKGRLLFEFKGSGVVRCTRLEAKDIIPERWSAAGNPNIPPADLCIFSGDGGVRAAGDKTEFSVSPARSEQYCLLFEGGTACGEGPLAINIPCHFIAQLVVGDAGRTREYARCVGERFFKNDDPN